MRGECARRAVELCMFGIRAEFYRRRMDGLSKFQETRALRADSWTSSNTADPRNRSGYVREADVGAVGAFVAKISKRMKSNQIITLESFSTLLRIRVSLSRNSIT